MNPGDDLKNILEAALLAAGKTLTLEQLQSLFEEHEQPERKAMRAALETLNADYEGRGIEVHEVSSGWRIQVRKDYAAWVSRLWDEKPGRYSRALMETLALIAYRQPITRGEIEDIRGVSVSTHITKTLLEREWVRVVGHRDVPGKPALYGTTREFLDYFDLKSLDDLPPLAELRDLDEINRELNLADPDQTSIEGEDASRTVSSDTEAGEEESVDQEFGESTGTGTRTSDGASEAGAGSVSGDDASDHDRADSDRGDQPEINQGPEESTDASTVQESSEDTDAVDAEPSDTPMPDEAEALEEPKHHG